MTEDSPAAPSPSEDPGTTTRWTLRAVEDEAAVDQIASDLNALPHALARSLALRGVRSFDDAHTFFRPALGRLHDPGLMRDMDRAVERVARAVRGGERVLVYGDYDVDGTTSTAMMTTFLQGQGLDTSFFIPNRFEHGYGLGEAGIDAAVERGASLIVALDCGITAVDEAAYAKARGLDLVICDHHTAGDVLPDAVAVLDPKRPDCDYPFKGLSGCGVGFKLIQGVLAELGLPPEEAWPYLDLVAVSTACDIVPMVGENRVLMRAGLKQLVERPRLGLTLLADRAGVDLDACTASKMVFQIGPRINAAGRIADAGIAAELLATTDAVEGQRLVDEIEGLNIRRRELDRETRDEAFRLAERQMDDDPLALVVYKPGWHPGVIGITASRVAEHFHRPTVLMTSNGDTRTAKGSARSVQGISIYDALAQCSDLLDRFGGHAFAAGLALPIDRVDELRRRMQDAVGLAVDDPSDLVPEIEVDAHLHLGDVTPRFWSVLKQFGPHGPDNLRPVFWGEGLRVVGQPSRVGAQKQHLRLRVAQQEGGATFPVIGFGLSERYDAALASVRRGRPLELAFQVDENTWNGRTTLQLKAQDLRVAEV
ncbi:single-stranded-DNA-specific exonuclease RecJ [Rubrivirga sp. S365]|uniref:Single-stranded-DNA-specific exonuclease RecJ n=1 Tax=Rubrivirga litoralis TaxID=3075598 RepID=A0ABU3BQY7_9BACT|nr:MULTISPECIES: single-stranded-DNA-specific exonuclease RecJ [unclassified Rubrivirga]MDT0631699.1 single-stranded-DNA-specific exonuclease RecJ [Rubrivirga sp. F394]MDT7855557.1 single-stranded-DNA-specific exonuclease RecJ [Rubrivirga sp. S365]